MQHMNNIEVDEIRKTHLKKICFVCAYEQQMQGDFLFSFGYAFIYMYIVGMVVVLHLSRQSGKRNST